MSKKTLIEAGALRQLKHNDGSDGFVFAYDIEVTDRVIAGLEATAFERGRQAGIAESQSPRQKVGAGDGNTYVVHDVPVSIVQRQMGSISDEQVWEHYRKLDLPHTPVIWTAALGTVRAVIAAMSTTRSEG